MVTIVTTMAVIAVMRLSRMTALETMNVRILFMVEAVDDVEVKMSVVLVSVLARATMMLMKFSQLNMAMSGNEDMSDNKVP